LTALQLFERIKMDEKATLEYIQGISGRYKGHGAIFRLRLAADAFPVHGRVALEAAISAAKETYDFGEYEKLCAKHGCVDKDATWITMTRDYLQSRQIDLEKELSLQQSHALRDGMRVSSGTLGLFLARVSSPPTHSYPLSIHKLFTLCSALIWIWPPSMQAGVPFLRPLNMG